MLEELKGKEKEVFLSLVINHNLDIGIKKKINFSTINMGGIGAV
jgi:hypothetical protein